MRSILVAAALLALVPPQAQAEPKPFTIRDLVMMDRVSDPLLSPNSSRIAFSVRETDFEANKGRNGLWVVDATGGQARRLTDKSWSASSPRWAGNDQLYFLAAKDGVSQLHRVRAEGGPAIAVTNFPLDIGSYRLSPDGRQVVFSFETFPSCENEADVLGCTQKKLDARKADKASGMVFDKLFIRHWESWADGRRSQLFIADLDTEGKAGKLKLLTRGIDGDVPSKPFGDDSEYAFSPDGKTVYFNARIAGTSEPWSTNFDVFSVPADGSALPKNLTESNKAWDGYPLASRDGTTLYYLAMKRPGFEADRFGIMALDLSTGQAREINPDWDYSAAALKQSADGKTLYTTTTDNGEHVLYAIDAASGKATRVAGEGSITGFDVGANGFVIARQDWQHPTDLYTLASPGDKPKQLTRFNADRLKNLRFGDGEFFTFKGAGGATVQGYVVKPAGYQKGKKYPVAFIIHGGPQGAMTNDFHYRWNPQVYAGAGFAVVTINFHGSTGYGQKFTDSISGDWGGAPLEDLKLGWAAAQQKYAFLDGDRACALGASYGGFMAFWIAGVWNEPWRCIVSHDGVFDARMMSYSTEELWFDEWEHNGKTQYEDPAAYEKFNPVNHVKNWKKPILVIHGEKDYRIPPEQGIAAFTAAQRRGIPSKLLYFPDENHWVLKPHNSVLWYDTVLGWLKQWTQENTDGDSSKASSTAPRRQ